MQIFVYKKNLSEKMVIISSIAGATKITPSKRSKIPPWPGTIDPESFTSKVRFIFDSNKSPPCSIIAKIVLTVMKKIAELTENIKELKKPMTAAANVPQSRPEIVLFGLIVGANLGPPKFLPPK